LFGVWGSAGCSSALVFFFFFLFLFITFLVTNKPGFYTHGQLGDVPGLDC